MEDRRSNLIRLKGVPPKATAADVKEFFNGIDIDSECIYLNFKERRGAGEALILFNSLEDAERALEKDKDFFGPKFGQRYVRLLPAEDLSLDDNRHFQRMAACRAGQRQTVSSDELSSYGVVKVDGLPRSITMAELMQLFWGTCASPARSVIQRSVSQKMSAHAFLDFGHPDQAAHAVANWHGTVMTTAAGMFTLSLQLATRNDFDKAKCSSNKQDAVLKVRGLPIRAAVHDVVAFFDGYKLKVGGVHLQPVSDNRHSKVAYVEFETVDEALGAMEKNHQLFGKAFGDRYCLLQRVQREEMEAELVRFAVKAAGTSSRSTSVSAAASLDFSTGSMGTTQPNCIPQRGAFPPMQPGFMFPGAYGAHLAAGMMPPPWATAMGLGMGMPGGPGFPSMGPPTPFGIAPSTARYVVQDLSTGQKVFLDPRFNVYPGQGPPIGMGVFPGSGAMTDTTATVTEPNGNCALPDHSYSVECDNPNRGLGVRNIPQAFHDNGGSKTSGLTVETVAAQQRVFGDGSGGGARTDKKGGSGAGSNEGSDGSDSGKKEGDPLSTTNGNGASIANIFDHTHATFNEARNKGNSNCGVTSALRDSFKKEPHKRVNLELNLLGDDRPFKHVHKDDGNLEIESEPTTTVAMDGDGLV